MAIATGRRGMGGIAREARGRGQVEDKLIGFGPLVVSLKKIKFYNKAVSQFL